MDTSPCPMRTLVERLGVSQSAVSQTVAEMVRRGLIIVDRDPLDARSRRIDLTAKAREILPVVQRCWDATEAVSATLDQDLGMSLPTILAKAITALERRALGERIEEARVKMQGDLG